MTLLLLTFAIIAALPQFVVAQDSDKATIHLFNGKNLDGWYSILSSKGKNNDPDKVFTVEDGAIHISGTEHGCITTNNEYENYTLEVEYKYGEKSHGGRKGAAFDSGVLVHSQGKDGAFYGNWMNSIEVQVIEAGTGDFYVVSQKKDENFSITSTVDPKTAFNNGGGYFDPKGTETTVYTPSNPVHRLGYDTDRQGQGAKGVRNKNEIEKPRGEWNTLKIVAKGDTLDIFLNGQLVNKATNVKPQKGRIQIQSEGAEFFYRRVDLTPIAQ
jgi:hypothetical protein